MYRITITLILTFLCAQMLPAQPTNVDCSNAIDLCAGQPIKGNNTGALSVPGYCSSSSRMLWYTFYTNSQGGVATLSLQNINCPAIQGMDNELSLVVLAGNGTCILSSFIAVSNCVSGTTTATVTTDPLQPETQYWVVLSGNLNGGATIVAQCDFSLLASGPGVDIVGVDLDAGPDVAIALGEATQLQGIAPNFSWSPPDSLSALNIADPIASPTSTTLYTLTCTIGECAYSDDILITVNDPISIDEIDAGPHLSAFPDPGTDHFDLILTPGEHTITLFDSTGRLALSRRVLGERITVDTSQLASGSYVVQVDHNPISIRWAKE